MPSPRSTTVTITSGQTVSAASQDIGEFAVVALIMPAAFTGTAVTFQVSADGTTFGVLTRPDGITYSVAVAASLAIPIHGPLFHPFRYVKVVSGSAEGSDRIVRLVLDLAAGGSMPAAAISGAVDTELPPAAVLADATATPTVPAVAANNTLYNGATWDMQRANTDNTALASASRTTTAQGTSADLVNHNARGIKVTLDVTVVGTGSITLAIQAKDALSGKYTALLTGAAVVTAVTNVYTLYPGATVAANVSASDVLPRNFRILVTHNNANAITYSVGYALVV
jgi:hypothetical protein